MDEFGRLNKMYSYAFYGASFLILLLSALLSNAEYLPISALLILASAGYLNSGHIINNFLIKRSKVIRIENGYQLGRNLASAVRKVNDSYIGVSIAILEINKTTEDKNGIFESIINNIKEPFEFSVSMKEIDKQRLVESLETRKKMKEISLSRISPKMYNKTNQIKKELEILNKEIANITRGDRSLEVMIKLKATKVSKDKIEAESEPPKSIVRIASAFCTNLGLEYKILSGEELLANIM